MYREFPGKTDEIKDDHNRNEYRKHIMMYSTLKITMFKNELLYGFKKWLWQIILLFPLQPGQISTLKRSQMSSF